MIHFYPEVSSNPKVFMTTIFHLPVFEGHYLSIGSRVTAAGSVIWSKGWSLDATRSRLPRAQRGVFTFDDIFWPPSLTPFRKVVEFGYLSLYVLAPYRFLYV